MKIHVIAAPKETRGTLTFEGSSYPCALGRAGLIKAELKTEGDGATPTGTWPLREVLFRADRLTRPETQLTCSSILPSDGWCDAPHDPAYNRPVTLPYPASTETLTRDDELYDLIVPLGYNDDPPQAGKGSAIFFHVAKEADHQLQPTEGCVALTLPDLLNVLKNCGLDTMMEIALCDH